VQDVFFVERFRSCVGFAYEQNTECTDPLPPWHFTIFISVCNGGVFSVACTVGCIFSCNRSAVASCVYTCPISVKYIESDDGSMLCRNQHSTAFSQTGQR
jgi:hypothetical protein